MRNIIHLKKESQSMKESLTKKEKIQRIIYSVILVFAVIVFANFVIKYGKITDKQLISKTEAYNKTLPLTIDKYARVDSVKVAHPEVLNYYITCVDIIKEESDSDMMEKYVYPELLYNIKENPEIDNFRNNKITIRYLLYDKNGNFLNEHIITPEMYKK